MSDNPQLDLLARDQQRAEQAAEQAPMTLFKNTFALTAAWRGHPLIAMLPFVPAAIRWYNANKLTPAQQAEKQAQLRANLWPPATKRALLRATEFQDLRDNLQRSKRLFRKD